MSFTEFAEALRTRDGVPVLTYDCPQHLYNWLTSKRYGFDKDDIIVFPMTVSCDKVQSILQAFYDKATKGKDLRTRYVVFQIPDFHLRPVRPAALEARCNLIHALVRQQADMYPVRSAEEDTTPDLFQIAIVTDLGWPSLPPLFAKDANLPLNIVPLTLTPLGTLHDDAPKEALDDERAHAVEAAKVKGRKEKRTAALEAKEAAKKKKKQTPPRADPTVHPRASAAKKRGRKAAVKAPEDLAPAPPDNLQVVVADAHEPAEKKTAMDPTVFVPASADVGTEGNGGEEEEVNVCEPQPLTTSTMPDVPLPVRIPSNVSTASDCSREQIRPTSAASNP
jgi:hypothetical protein